MAALLAAGLLGCGSPVAPTAVGVRSSSSALEAANGLSPNGLMRNGLMRNGLMRNGLMRNGLTENGLMRNGLLSADFQTWFDEDPTSSDTVMGYLVRCAAPAGQSYSFTSATSGITYTWTGALGLAPGFASGLAPTTAEEQLISACLAAHVNKYGRQVWISILGADATGTPISTAKRELKTYSQREACFFGNLFKGEGVFAGADHTFWDGTTSSARACAISVVALGPNADCPPIQNVGPCWLICKPDASGNSYQSCGTWVNGAWKTYLPLTTRLLPADVYRCGDGACQFTESCGTGTTSDSCQADCGTCPGTTTETTTPTGQTNTKKSH